MSIDTEPDHDGEPKPAEGGLDEIAEALVAQARADGVALTGDGGLLGGLIQRVLEGALDAEMTEHLGYEPHAVEGRNTGNSRNVDGPLDREPDHRPDHRRIESLNARFRKAAVRRGHFPTEESALKVLYLTAIERRKNRTNPTGRINGWKQILNALTIHYSDRITAAQQ